MLQGKKHSPATTRMTLFISQIKTTLDTKICFDLVNFHFDRRQAFSSLSLLTVDNFCICKSFKKVINIYIFFKKRYITHGVNPRTK